MVYVTNPPDELYYLDLLTRNADKYDNFLEDGERGALNQDMLALLYSYADEGWEPAFTEGTGIPIFGKLTGDPDGGCMVHEFGYYGVPDSYRIIIVTESGKVSVSDEHTRVAMQSSVTYDYATGISTIPPAWYVYAVQFAFTFLATLLIEGIILVLFGYRLKKNWKVFLLANLITQVILSVTVGASLIKGGTISAFIVQFPAEIVILTAETLIFRQLLSGQSKLRGTVYGITANFASWFIGFVSMSPLFYFLVKLL